MIIKLKETEKNAYWINHNNLEYLLLKLSSLSNGRLDFYIEGYYSIYMNFIYYV